MENRLGEKHGQIGSSQIIRERSNTRCSVPAWSLDMNVERGLRSRSLEWVSELGVERDFSV